MVASHGDGEDAGPAQVQPGPPRRCAWRATEGLHASNGPCTNGGARMGAGRHVLGPDPGPDRQVGDGRGCRDNQVSHCPGCRAWGHNQHPPSHTLDRSTGLFWVPQPIFSSMPTSTVEVLISLALSISASPTAFPPARLLSSSSSSPSSSSSRPSPAHGLTLSL